MHSPSPQQNHRGSRIRYLEQDNESRGLASRLDFGRDQLPLDKDDKPIVQ